MRHLLRRTPRRFISPLLLATAFLLGESPAIADPPASEASLNWPAYNAGGSFAPALPDGLEPIDSPQQVRKLWETDHHMGYGKMSASGAMKNAKQADVEQPFSGGVASPIAADGKVFVTYFRPAGDVIDNTGRNRYFDLSREDLPVSMKKIDGDDVLVAFDAETGKLLWEAIEEKKGMNFMSGKRGHIGCAPAYADGRVFSMGATGRVYGYDARTGKKLWESNIGPAHEMVERIKAKSLENNRMHNVYGHTPWRGWQGGMNVLAGVLIAPMYHNEGIIAFDPETGDKLWSHESMLGHKAAPARWRHGGKEYALVNTKSGNVALIEPKSGKVLWSVAMGGQNTWPLTVNEDHFFANTVKVPGYGDRFEGVARWTCFKITLDGPVRQWALPEDEKFSLRRGAVVLDSGPGRKVVIEDGRAYLFVSPGKKIASDAIVVADLKTGRIIQYNPLAKKWSIPVPLGDLLVAHRDVHHGPNDAGLELFQIVDEGLSYLGATDAQHLQITAYAGVMENPFYNGRLYTRSMKGIACYSLVKPK